MRRVLIVVTIIILSVAIVPVASANDYYWAKSFSGGWYDIGYDVKFIENGNIIVLGVTKSFGAGGNDFFIINLR